MTTPGPGHNSGVAAKRLRAFIERVERLEEDRANLNDDLREVYAEAKSAGFDTKTIRTVVKLRRIEANVRQEQDHLLEVYREAVGI